MSPSAYRRVTLLALVALYFIVVTGGLVRITGSGLGCPDWPTCAQHRVVAPLEYHALVEFVNRVVTGAVSLVVIAAVLASVFRKPWRRDLVWLSAGLVAGVVGQIVLGGLTVLFDLKPPFVMAHFLLSLLILWCAVALHHRAGLPDDSPVLCRESHVWRGVSRQRSAGRLVVAAAAIVVFLGTVVTSSGPHGGDPKAERLPFALHDVARLHGTAAMLLVGVVLWATVLVVRSRAGGEAVRRAEVLVGVLVAQVAVGYVQYFTRLPAALVGLHVAGAGAVWVAALRFHLAVAAVPA